MCRPRVLCSLSLVSISWSWVSGGDIVLTSSCGKQRSLSIWNKQEVTRTIANRDTAGYINCHLIGMVFCQQDSPKILKRKIPMVIPRARARWASSKYHVPYLGYLAAASQPSFDTGNVPSTMRRHYFIKLCFREISTPHPVSSLHKAISLRSLYRGEFWD